jgi:hypothetical protein
MSGVYRGTFAFGPHSFKRMFAAWSPSPDFLVDILGDSPCSYLEELACFVCDAVYCFVL